MVDRFTASRPPPRITAAPVVLIRADAGGLLGTGHVMRMLALAQALHESGCTVHFACVQCPDGLVDRLAHEGFPVHRLGACELGGADDAARTATLGRDLSALWITLDGYHFGYGLQQRLHDRGFKVMAVDDYGHAATWCADLLLNQNLDAGGRSYSNDICDGVVLRGPSFALLRREFWATEPAPLMPVGRTVTNILVTLGGVDTANVTGRVLSSLPSVRSGAIHLKVLVGAGNPHRLALQMQAETGRHPTELITDCLDMPAMYRWADAVISAGGSTCYEWMLFGLPAAVIVIAENQEVIAGALGRDRRAHILRPAEEDWAPSLAHWLDTLRAAPRTPSSLVDGQGARRVAQALGRQSIETSEREAVTHA